MTRASMIALVVAAFAAMLGGCATTVEMGPGYYHYDTRLSSRPVTYSESTVVYDTPARIYYYRY